MSKTIDAPALCEEIRKPLNELIEVISRWADSVEEYSEMKGSKLDQVRLTEALDYIVKAGPNLRMAQDLLNLTEGTEQRKKIETILDIINGRITLDG